MTVAVDTSVAVPLLVRSHHDHAAVARWWNGQEITVSGHALAETYSVLTRLPGDARLAPADAARTLPDTLSRLGIAGGAVYDALVALAAQEHGAALATRDARARGTYDAVGVKVIVVT
ncbi:MAG TPA: PIN domain-containing protein [Streptosporangiaceae bacterium]|nr:PIN domain-containing protein [Streptosporangiaceae bacterium]